ncbi:hypothetical protein AYO44_17675 [Planctomycetaceae bacterium SCGC AG-212-F19]|nr:hypothetical protein AYO44_17675 [Planctomycetaceae bacterium SCGC AG-212-F19]
MREQEWLVCDQWLSMWDFIRDHPSERKRRLFSCGCCRRIWELLSDERSRAVVLVAERFADSQATKWELHTADNDALDAYYDAGTPTRDAAATALTASRTETWSVFSASEYSRLAPAGKDHAEILRCIFGSLPFRSVTITPSWLTTNVVSLAQAIYDERAFDRMPILADALEDAGCDNADVLNHCRQPGEHVRGCWVVDLLLGRS